MLQCTVTVASTQATKREDQRARGSDSAREPKSLLQANITIDHRSQITEREKEREERKKDERETDHRSQKKR